jgi:hypothetical protein
MRLGLPFYAEPIFEIKSSTDRVTVMIQFFQVLFLIVVALSEISVAFIMMPILGIVPTITIEVLLFILFALIYVAVFRKRHAS